MSKKYKQFKTCCYKCGKSLLTIQFHVHLGGQSFALCPKHLEEYEKITSKFMVR